MEVRVLGPLEARRDGVVRPISARMNRALLAILVVARGEVVPADRIGDLLGGGAPPPKATAALHTKVAHLRRALQAERAPRSEDSLIRTSPAGYRIARDDVELDADVFERLVEQARPLPGADPGRAAALLDEALGLWRGPALAEFADEPFAEATVQRLESLRLTALELRAEAALGLGAAARAVDELTSHVAAHPLREQARASLARALYLAGRQADALTVLAEGRRLLRDELGLDPGPELQRLESQILAHDPALAPRRKAPAPPTADPARLVGRAAETALLSAAVRAAGGTVRSATCRDGSAAPPFWPVLQLVREAAAEAGPEERERLAEALGPLADVLPDRGGRTAAGGVDPAMVLVHLADALVRTLRGAVPALVVLDDLHAADPATLRLVAALAADVAAPTVLALGLRTGEGDSPPPPDTLAALGRAPRLLRLDLDPLPADAVAELVRTSLADPAADVARLVDRADGNPFFALELARASAPTPRGRPVGGVPATVYDVLRSRFLRLPRPGWSCSPRPRWPAGRCGPITSPRSGACRPTRRSTCSTPPPGRPAARRRRRRLLCRSARTGGRGAAGLPLQRPARPAAPGGRRAAGRPRRRRAGRTGRRPPPGRPRPGRRGGRAAVAGARLRRRGPGVGVQRRPRAERAGAHRRGAGGPPS